MPKAGGKSKRGGGLRVLWIPTGGHKSHKHKKNKHYSHDNWDSPQSAMMSGDSPNSHTNKNLFDFKEGRSTPPPTTSKDMAIQSSSTGGADAKADVVAASVLADPLKEHCFGANYIGLLDRNKQRKNHDEIVATNDNLSKNDHGPDSGDNRDKKDASKKINGTIDKLDGKLALLGDNKKEDEVDDDSCGVKCLYYTLQCCECTIM